MCKQLGDFDRPSERGSTLTHVEKRMLSYSFNTVMHFCKWQTVFIYIRKFSIFLSNSDNQMSSLLNFSQWWVHLDWSRGSSQICFSSKYLHLFDSLIKINKYNNVIIVNTVIGIVSLFKYFKRFFTSSYTWEMKGHRWDKTFFNVLFTYVEEIKTEEKIKNMNIYIFFTKYIYAVFSRLFAFPFFSFTY